MTTATSELARFHCFLGERLQQSDADTISPEEALAQWREQGDTLAAIREGLADIDAGRTIPFEQFVRAFCDRHHLPNPS